MSEITIQIPATSGGMSTAGSSFDAAWSQVLWHRVRLIMVMGFLATVFFSVLTLLFGMEPVAFKNLELPYQFVTPLIWLTGLVLLYLGNRSGPHVQATAMWVVLLVLAVMTIADGALYPQQDKLAGAAVLLLIMAAFVPCRLGQVWLAVMAVAFAAVGLFVVPALIPEVAAYWADMGGRRASWERLFQLIAVAMIGLISIVVSRSLYSLERTAHKARRLGNYLIDRELGRGGMGQVFVARHAMICRPTAVKVLEPTADVEAAVARFEREVQLSASLTHPNTITIFDYGRTADNTFYYAMEYLDGLNLQSLVERFGPIPTDRAIYLMRQILGSLAEAHERGIVHRDIKPSNIFVTHRGGLFDFIKVLDFGLAREVRTAGDDGGLTKAGMVFGTPRYIAPETVYGAREADARSDLYNLGGVMYWMLTGEPLFGDSSSLDLIIDHVKTVPRRPSEVSDMPIPAEMDEIVMRLLEKEPAKRFQSAAEVKHALKTVPVAERWSQDQARDWWVLRAPEAIPDADCGCAPTDDVQPAPSTRLAFGSV